MIPNWRIKQSTGNFDFIKGDTLNSRKITFPFEITNCRIDMQFRKQANDTIVFKWSTEDDTFEKISENEIIMKSINLNFPPYNYISDLQVIFENGTILTYFKASLNIVQDITIAP